MNYSFLDRLLHKVAFGVPRIQSFIEGLESSVFAERFRSIDATRPIFITSLPRAGTTILLEALSRFPQVATHIYRDMPFVMAPLFWARVSGAFQKSSTLSERAHGDGILIGYDSPEAFEEILWKELWPAKYRNDRIELWQGSDADMAAQAFLTDHMRKIIALRLPTGAKAPRYLSKNNANIARLSLLPQMFPECHILVPLRHPLDHALSMHRQNENFCELQDKQAFTRRYMADIGHYEFGKLHKPLNFPGLDSICNGRASSSLDYWLAYWIAAFEYVRPFKSRLVILPFETLCRFPESGLSALAEQLDIETPDIGKIASMFKPVVSNHDPSQFDATLKNRAITLYNELIGSAPERFIC